ncbi:hypothetical protein B0H13DRAFT_678935 [Mycena leptocephala]|nr:hypothetical protein B0H13DRAFT_347527 [Mycena leptocephala]KAJ7907821.1 hypothetical protein B0H13DRAFT_678935 [Mycena leptocephala]
MSLSKPHTRTVASRVLPPPTPSTQEGLYRVVTTTMGRSSPRPIDALAPSAVPTPIPTPPVLILSLLLPLLPPLHARHRQHTFFAWTRLSATATHVVPYAIVMQILTVGMSPPPSPSTCTCPSSPSTSKQMQTQTKTQSRLTRTYRSRVWT